MRFRSTQKINCDKTKTASFQLNMRNMSYHAARSLSLSFLGEFPSLLTATLCVADTKKVHKANMACEACCHKDESAAANAGSTNQHIIHTHCRTSQRVLAAIGGTCYYQPRALCKRHQKPSLKKTHTHTKTSHAFSLQLIDDRPQTWTTSRKYVC